MSHLGRGHHHKQQRLFNYFLQVELKVYCYANWTFSPSYLSISWLRSSSGSHPIAQTMSGRALPPRRGDETWACKWAVFWVAFLLWHLMSKAGSSPSLPPALPHRCNRLSGLPHSCSFRTISPQFHKKTMLAQWLGCHTSLPPEQGQSSANKTTLNYAQLHMNAKVSTTSREQSR